MDFRDSCWEGIPFPQVPLLDGEDIMDYAHRIVQECPQNLSLIEMRYQNHGEVELAGIYPIGRYASIEYQVHKYQPQKQAVHKETISSSKPEELMGAVYAQKDCDNAESAHSDELETTTIVRELETQYSHEKIQHYFFVYASRIPIGDTTYPNYIHRISLEDIFDFPGLRTKIESESEVQI